MREIKGISTRKKRMQRKSVNKKFEFKDRSSEA